MSVVARPVGLPLDEADLVLLHAAASAMSVSEVARTVGLAPRVALRRLDRLEHRLDLELLHRNEDRVTVSPTGRRVLAAGASLLAALAAAARSTVDAAAGARRLSLDDVRLLHAVAETGSLNRAARVLLVSQPALSRRVRRLEETMGTALLVRSHRGTVLSPSAGALLGQISDAVAEFRAALTQ